MTLGRGALLLAVTALLSTSAPAQRSGDATEATLPGEINAWFLFSAFQARLALKDLGPAERTLAENFWTLATEFSETVRRAEPQQQELYAPLLRGFQMTLEQQVLGEGGPDVEAVSRMRALLLEQVEISRSLGSDPGLAASVTATIRAVTGSQARPGFYVWLDSPCCAPPRSSLQPIAGMTNNATKRITRASYLVRIVGQNNRVVGSRELFIGQDMTPTARVDVMIPATAR